LRVSTKQVRCLSRHQEQRATPRSGPLCFRSTRLGPVDANLYRSQDDRALT